MKHEHSQSKVELCNVLKHLQKPPPAPSFTSALRLTKQVSITLIYLLLQKYEKMEKVETT